MARFATENVLSLSFHVADSNDIRLGSCRIMEIRLLPIANVLTNDLAVYVALDNLPNYGSDLGYLQTTILCLRIGYYQAYGLTMRLKNFPS